MDKLNPTSRITGWVSPRPFQATHFEMVQDPEFTVREQGYTFVSHQQEVGTGYFDDVTTVIHPGRLPQGVGFFAFLDGRPQDAVSTLWSARI